MKRKSNPKIKKVKILTTVPDEVKRQAFIDKSRTYSSFSDRVKLAEELKKWAYDIPRHDGYLLCDSDQFIETMNIVSSTLDIINASNIKSWKSKGKQYIKTGILDQSKLTIDSSFLKFALRKDIVATVSKYLGHIPILMSVMILYSRYDADNLVGTQLYHCDYEDINNIKIFINATDVLSKQDGPLTLVSSEKSKQIRHLMLKKYKGSKVQLTSKYEFEFINDNVAAPMFGKRGSVVFADTCGCFHMGSRIAPDKPDRIMVVLQYISPAAINIDTSYDKRPFAKLASKDMELYKRYVLGEDI